MSGTAPEKNPGGDRKGARDFRRGPKAYYSNATVFFYIPKKGIEPRPYLGPLCAVPAGYRFCGRANIDLLFNTFICETNQLKNLSFCTDLQNWEENHKERKTEMKLSSRSVIDKEKSSRIILTVNRKKDHFFFYILFLKREKKLVENRPLV